MHEFAFGWGSISLLPQSTVFSIDLCAVRELAIDSIYLLTHLTSPHTCTNDLWSRYAWYIWQSIARKLVPLADRVLVRRIIPEAKTASGLILSADTSALKANEATVIAVGPGALSRDGARIAVQVKEGDKVLLPEYGGTKVKLGEEELFLFNDADILGKFQ